MNTRVFGRYPSTPESDVDILVIRTSKDADQANLQIVYNMEAPEAVLSELKEKLPSIISTVTAFADKYHITESIEMLKDSVIHYISEAYNVAINYDAQMSQLSIFFRNTIVRYQKTVQTFLDALIKVLRETRFKLSGFDEMTTLPELLMKLTNSIANMLDVTIQVIQENMEEYYNSLAEKITNAKLQIPNGDVISGDQIINQVKTALKKISDEVVDFVKNVESLDTILEKMGETLKAVVEKTQELVDSISSDYLDALFININRLYRELITIIKNRVDQSSAFGMEEFNRVCEFIVDSIIKAIDKFNNAFYGYLQQASEEVQAYMTVTDGKVELNIPFRFQF